MIKKKIKMSPIVTFIILSFVTLLVSAFLHFINVQGEYVTVNKVTNELVNNVVEVKNLLSGSGIKHIVTTAVSGFVGFSPLSMLIIVLIGIGILEKTGFTRAFFTLLTKNAKKNTLTFALVFVCLLFSLFGDVGYVVMLPIGALLFKYGRRNPLGGIIASFASLSFGYGINMLLSANDSSLLTLTINAAKVIDPKYNVGIFFSLFIMIFALFAMAMTFTYITEKKIMPKLGKYEHEEEEFKITKKELRGIIIGIGAGILYTLLIIYMIIPGLPFSGALLDNGANRYIDMLFGNNSLFNQAFIFILTLLFFIIGLGYGLMTKQFKNNKDIAESLGYSLDGIGSTLVLIFFASLFINIFNESNIGIVCSAAVANLISKLSFNGVWLIVIALILITFVNLLMPNSIVKWSIMSASIIPLFMNASISPEFAQILFNAGDSITNGLTPLLTFFVIYIAFMEKFNKSEDITLFGSLKYMVPYSIASFAIWFVVLVGWYIVGAPIGIGSFPGVSYGA